ncbi:hypothetical protein GUJ93_ZPchr0001g32187 [Zizania palustris]|uniref:Metallo-beta-lactamase domain-containing protein n=1 Tax=Zizania palustris TaxID=103762 RepID=A0A8J5RPI5_ZIZPA|nr:hypothetical protein GUJ93_ZPchr0001g32187 [Zizania palustris]
MSLYRHIPKLRGIAGAWRYNRSSKNYPLVSSSNGADHKPPDDTKGVLGSLACDDDECGDEDVIPLPVWHGKGYCSLGFRFGRICYISDVSDIPEETYKLMEGCELLILDALRPDRSSSMHFGLPRALEEVRKIKPKKTLFPGNHLRLLN